MAAEELERQDKVKKNKLSCVAVYCGARDGKKISVYGAVAEELGHCLADNGVDVVYGGSRFGIMGKMADAVLAKGGNLTGIIPKFFTEYENYTAPGKEIVVPDMHTRKKMMFDMADAFIALPGGIGTMEELAEILTWSTLDLHSKPVAILNVDGYYDHFLLWIQRALDDGLITSNNCNIDELMIVSHDPHVLVDMLRTKKEE